VSQLFLSHPVLSSQSVSQQIYDFLRSAIIDGTLKPNQRLVEKSLAEELQVSRTPVREALRHLEVEGLIQYLPQRRVLVRQFSPEEIAEVYDLRILLEGYAARLAAKRARFDDIQALEHLCADFEATLRNEPDLIQQVYRLVNLNDRLHATILQISGNRRLMQTVRIATEMPLVYRSYWHTDVHRKSSNEYHKRIALAIKEQDAARAEELMHEHLTRAKGFVLEQLSSL
jgi:DNA-binding GntR family transcriptional regulator